MMQLHGKISDKLRAMFAPGDQVWTPQRDNTTPKKAKKLPKGVDGQSMTGRKPKKK